MVAVVACGQAAAQSLPAPGLPAPPPMHEAPAAPPAAGGGLLTLDAALARTAERSPLLAAARKEVEALQGGIVQAGVRPNPELAISVEDTRRDTRTTAAQVGIPIELGGKRQARIVAAERARTVAEADLVSQQAALRAATVAAFFDVLVAQEALALARGAREVAVRAVDIAAKRVAAGKVPPLEEDRARVEQANAELDIEAARSRLMQARQGLGALWDERDPGFGTAAGDLETLPQRPPADELLRQLEQAPDLAGSRLEIERREAVKDLERSKQYPDVRLTAGTQRNNELGRNQALIGIAIPLPLFDRNQGNVYEATVRADQARDMHRALAARLARDLEQASSRLALARGSAETLRHTVMPAANRAYDAATRGFEAGKFGFLDVLDAQRTLFQARLRHLAVVADTYQAAVEIDRILGR
ncbi:Cobalt-zinc-cadmium resistance protein CzcC precursor [Pigmentiphaga humi]|uniref:Cobalt-zinc-cadmium resistance protein CzcC n=2 Tax=Pigmentiphaga humi TaxID=2478468 RepID=A0A3P4AYH8_9BURK|nr:Cobalt-zinc-cadmium resistance protein CzcC precursor [Pigmentiphaga humi]